MKNLALISAIVFGFATAESLACDPDQWCCAKMKNNRVVWQCDDTCPGFIDLTDNSCKKTAEAREYFLEAEQQIEFD